MQAGSRPGLHHASFTRYSEGLTLNLPVDHPTAWLARLMLCITLAVPVVAQAFGIKDVEARARTLAADSYRAPATKLPAELAAIDYDALRDIRFKPERATWRAEKLPFELMYFHPGKNFPDAVRINVVEPRGPRRVEFDTELFDYGRNKIDPKKLRNVGFSGFRVHYPINTRNYKDEVLVFLGASYFRSVGKGQVYGLSARGLAINTAVPSGEDFARFTEFWIDRPGRADTALTIYALLDSKHLTGAYKFVVTPGTETVIQVSAKLYFREAVAKLGIAPLNSMYFFGDNQPGHRDDYRPEVHDSDGLSVSVGNGEWVWRPLVNPKRLLVTSFASTQLQGFGLMQRDRSTASYEDPEALYERRPSAWVEPGGKWGPGRVELVQIPTPDETNDNIVAYWVPDKAPDPKKPFDLAYTIRWQLDGRLPTGRAWVVQTRRGRGYVKQPDGDLNFVVDFDGPPLRELKPEAKPEPFVELGGNAQLREKNLFLNPVTGMWRLTVRVKREDAAKPIEMRAQIRESGKVLTETWSYIVPPESEKP
ncbi:Glucan biosynthesis protein G OS=Rhizobacter sp. Root404 OX=1736528 GN=mdoG PE=3 SV=1 [Rhizobacter fulvus]